MILVTGATGFIGTNLMCALAEKDVYPVATYRHESNKDKIAALFISKFSDGKERFDKIIWRKVDLRNFPSLKEAFEGITHVYHCAAFISMAFRDSQKLLEINQKGTAYIVDLCLKNNIEKLLYVSSIASLGADPNLNTIDENTPWDNNVDKTPYAYSKYGAEMEVWRANQEGLDVAIVNPGIVLGPNSPIEKTFNRVKNGLRFYTPGRSGYVWIDDVVFVMIKLMESKIKAERFALVAENWSGKSVIQAVLKACNKNDKIIKASKGLLYCLWVFEHFIQLLGLRKRFFTKALISTLFDKRTVNGEKIKSYIDFEYTSIAKSLENTLNPKSI